MFEKGCVWDHLFRFEILGSSHFVLFGLVADVSNVQCVRQTMRLKCILKQFLNYVYLKHGWNVRFRKKKKKKKR